LYLFILLCRFGRFWRFTRQPEGVRQGEISDSFRQEVWSKVLLVIRRRRRRRRVRGQLGDRVDPHIGEESTRGADRTRREGPEGRKSSGKGIRTKIT
ncbi:MAG: hypothetical protein ACK56I_33550, partial [bacterium]